MFALVLAVVVDGYSLDLRHSLLLFIWVFFDWFFFQIDQKPLVERSFPKSSPSDLLYRVVDDLVPVTAGPDQGSERIGTLHQGDVS
jgi:hypothetical protein